MSDPNDLTDHNPSQPEPPQFGRGPARRTAEGSLPGGPADLTPSERELESDLARLRPTMKAAAPEELLRLAFRAGQAAAADTDVAGRNGRKLLLWRAAAAVLVSGLGLSLLSRPAPQVVERERVKVVFVERPVGPSATETSAVALHGDSRTGPDAPARSPLPTEADAANHSTLPEFLATSDSPSRPLIPAADADYLSVRDAVLRLGVRVIPSPRAGTPRGGPVTLEMLLGPSAPAPAAPARRGGVGGGLDEIRKFLTGGQT
jgi:hypothetical protein